MICYKCRQDTSVGPRGGMYPSPGIRLCPLHAAAPELYKELTRIYTEEAGGLKTETVDRVLRLLAAVQGGK